MSAKQTNLSEDIQRLRNDGYSVRIENSCLIVSDVPYLDESKIIREDGILFDIYPHNPNSHTFKFSAVPHTIEGRELHVAGKPNNWNGFNVKSELSFKKSDGKRIIPYVDHYDKVTYYINVISAHAKNINKDVDARKYRPIDTSEAEETPFLYEDLNSARAGINHVNEKLKKQKIAIIGLGGTGSYILDLVAKSAVSEIHIYDNDTFHAHNAFRAPGAADIRTVDVANKKVDYFHEIYSRIHKHIITHDYLVTAEVVEKEFDNYDFIFICVDANEHKRGLLLKLIEKNISFIDCGIGANEIDGSLNGTIRLTTVTQNKNDHLDKRIHCESNKGDDYDSNIQIAELNALNASLAVVKWKRMIGFYHNHENEHHSTYMFNCNSLSNDETI